MDIGRGPRGRGSGRECQIGGMVHCNASYVPTCWNNLAVESFALACLTADRVMRLAGHRLFQSIRSTGSLQ